MWAGARPAPPGAWKHDLFSSNSNLYAPSLADALPIPIQTAAKPVQRSGWSGEESANRANAPETMYAGESSMTYSSSQLEDSSMDTMLGIRGARLQSDQLQVRELAAQRALVVAQREAEEEKIRAVERDRARAIALEMQRRLHVAELGGHVVSVKGLVEGTSADDVKVSR